MIEVNRLALLTGHQNPIYALEPSLKPGLFFTAGNDKGIVEWSSKKQEFLKVLMPVNSSVYSLHALSFAPILASGERSGRINLFDFVDQRVKASLNHHNKPVFALSSVERKRELLATSEDGTVSIIDPANADLIYKFEVSKETVRCLAISPDEKLVAFGSKDNVIRIFDVEDYSLVAELRDHTMPVTSLQFSPDGLKLLSGSRDAQLKIWNVNDFSILETIPAHLFAIYDIKYHPNLPYFATASQDKSIKIWDSETYKLKKIISREKGFESHSHSVNKIFWERETFNLISVGDDKNVIIWGVEF
ncbi:WD40 repeat domain-containing protein [Desertivirga brevis]|uniref:WD40 repeat domain-containing protein n=1 Tax=Desertivirga brevis TaxID=2810310 RepID=UPI001A959EF0|nr:WD40 repeat domain-containing protein [Pedobacter sp. SYSU D00873]